MDIYYRFTVTRDDGMQKSREAVSEEIGQVLPTDIQIDDGTFTVDQEEIDKPLPGHPCALCGHKRAKV